MTVDPSNLQYGAGKGLFGQDGSPYASTGAPGSGISSDALNPDVMAGPVIANPAISIPGASSQIQANRPSVGVTAGDTSSMSSDNVVPSSGDPLTGLSQAQLTQTGAGQGTAVSPPHPNSMSGGGPR
jgi:hypothetical protein